MMPRNYYRPQTLDEAKQLLRRQPGSIALSGGAILLGGIEFPHETVIDLQNIARLSLIETHDQQIHVGGSARLQQLVDSPEIPAQLKTSIKRTVPVNIANNVSAGEAISVRHPPPEFLTTLAALGAEVKHTGYHAEDSENVLSVVEFVNALQSGGYPYPGIVLSLTFPQLTASMRLGTAYVARTPADIPIVNAAALITMDDDLTIKICRIAIAGVSNTPTMVFELNSLRGQTLEPSAIIKAIEDALVSIDPIADYRGSAEYRREMAKVIMRRACLLE